MLTRFVVLDLETTGLSPSWHRIVEISAILVEGGQVTRRFATLVNPGCPIGADATAVHGLTDRDVATSPSEPEALRGVLDFLDDPARLLVAHNAEFDTAFLAMALLRTGTGLPRNPVLDSLALARLVRPAVPSRSLDALASCYGVPVRHRHRALADCEVLANLLPLLARDASDGPRTVSRMLRPFHSMAFPEAPAPPGWEGLVRPGAAPVRILWELAGRRIESRVVPLRLVRRFGATSLLARLESGPPCEIPLRDVLQANGLPRPPAEPAGARRERVLEQVASGGDLSQAAREAGVERHDALRYVCEAVTRGTGLHWRHLASDSHLERVRRVLDARGPARLRTLRQELPGEISWDELHLGLASWYRARGVPHQVP